MVEEGQRAFPTGPAGGSDGGVQEEPGDRPFERKHPDGDARCSERAGPRRRGICRQRRRHWSVIWSPSVCYLPARRARAILCSLIPHHDTRQYGLEVLQMLEFATVLVNLIMMTQRPYFLVAIPILMTQSTQLLWYISCLLQGVSPGKLRLLDASLDKVMPAMLGSLGWSSKPVNARFAQLSAKVAQQTAMLDVLFGIALVLELVLPRRNVMLCFIYWQFLQMRFMMDRSGDLKAAFRTVDSRIMALTSHRFCPATLGKLYAKLKHFLASKVNPEQLRTQSRCSVM
ncbi:unnamed protein product [Phaeothamnion confervicola]